MPDSLKPSIPNILDIKYYNQEWLKSQMLKYWKLELVKFLLLWDFVSFFLPKNILVKFYNKMDISTLKKMTFACMCNRMLDYCWWFKQKTNLIWISTIFQMIRYIKTYFHVITKKIKCAYQFWQEYKVHHKQIIAFHLLSIKFLQKMYSF